MGTQIIKIKNMCCGRCITSVEQIFNQLGIKSKKVKLGFAEISPNPKVKDTQIEKALKAGGFEIIKSKDEEICEKVKIAIHQIFFDSDMEGLSDFNLRIYLEKQTGMTYKKLSQIFSSHNKKNIENYFILHRVEKAKALIDETEDLFSDIAFKLGYKSLSHLSRQFKTVEGVSMHDYKLKTTKRRKPIDKL